MKYTVMESSFVLVVLLACFPLLVAQSPTAQIVRRSPAAFPELPSNLTLELQRRGCTIPQETYSKNRNNVVKGEFAKKGQTDWAVLCSVKGISTILVFWSCSENNPAAIARSEDNGYIQAQSPGQFGYSRGIDAVGRDFIMRHYEAYGGPKPPPIDHQGIEDVFIEKGSVVWYFYEGQWLKLTGSD